VKLTAFRYTYVPRPSHDDDDNDLLLAQTIDTCPRHQAQRWTPQPVYAQSVSDTSLPVQSMLSSQFGPKPAP